MPQNTMYGIDICTALEVENTVPLMDHAPNQTSTVFCQTKVKKFKVLHHVCCLRSAHEHYDKSIRHVTMILNQASKGTVTRSLIHI